MQRLQAAIDRYNAIRTRYWDDDYNTLLAAGAAGAEAIARLQAHEPRPLPAELLEFYRRFGGLHNEGNDESFCLALPDPATLGRAGRDPAGADPARTGRWRGRAG